MWVIVAWITIDICIGLYKFDISGEGVTGIYH